MAQFIPFPAYPDFAPLDISYCFESEKPAGKHGFLKADGDVFRFEDGTEARFWGTNLNSGSAFPEHDYAEKLAKRLAAYGCNMVRFHQIDAEWATPSIYQLTKGKRLANTSTYDPASFDRLDYLMKCLKDEGIYVFLDMMTYRKFKTADGVRNANALIDRAAPYCIFDPILIELQKEYMKTLWEHVNPYTGLAYKDDPLIAMSDVTNEVDLFGTFNHKIQVEPYASEFRESFRAWCKDQGYGDFDVDAADLNDNTCEPLVEYKIEVTENYYNSMFDYMRSLGVKVPLTGVNYSWKWYSCKSAQHIGDFEDSHLNVRFMTWNPGKKISRNVACHDQAEWGAMRNARRRVYGKPFFTSEWDVTYPNRYRAESPILFAALGRLQNWSGYTIHTYAYTSLLQHMDILGKEVSSETIGGTGYREGIFSTWNDPAKFGLFYHASLITRRGDIAPAKNKITIRVGELNCDNKNAPGTLTSTEKKAFMASTELSQIGADYFGEDPDAVPDDTELVDLKKGEVRSDTGEMYRNWKKLYGTIDSPMTKCVYGRLAKQKEPIVLNGMTVQSTTDYAVIAVSSLENDKDIEHTDSMLISAVARVENTDQKMDLAPEKWQTDPFLPAYMEMKDFGHAPIVCEVVEADIAIKTDHTNFVIWAVNAEGVYVGKVPVTYEDGYMKFKLGTVSPSIYYLVEAE